MTDQTIATQVAHPWRATARTALAAGLGAILTVATIVPLVWPIIVEEVARQGLTIPQQVSAVAAVVVAISAALTAITTRLMALPAIDGLLGKISLSAAPAPRRGIED